MTSEPPIPEPTSPEPGPAPAAPEGSRPSAPGGAGPREPEGQPSRREPSEAADRDCDEPRREGRARSGSEPDPDTAAARPDGAQLIVLAILFYALLVGAALTWLWLRDRLQVIPARAVGRHGTLVAVAAGAGVALAAIGSFALLRRYLAAFRGLERRLRAVLGPLHESQIVILSVASGVGEELFFRGAAHDALGPWWSAALFGALHGPGGRWIWPLLAFAIGLLFSAMIEGGFGLLSVSLAHALVNYLSLRRMNPV